VRDHVIFNHSYKAYIELVVEVEYLDLKSDKEKIPDLGRVRRAGYT
jgi:hypothetical protein